MWKVGSNYLVSRVKTDNPFWKNILHIWNRFCSKVSLSKKDFLYEPLWFTVKFKNVDLFIYNWFRYGICTISDIIDDNGTPFTFEKIKELYSVEGTVLDYYRVLNSIPREWLQKLEHGSFDKCSPGRCKALQVLLSCAKGCSVLYKVLISSSSTVPSQNRWVAELEDYNHGAILSCGTTIIKYHGNVLLIRNCKHYN
jgi:hypothetical protein